MFYIAAQANKKTQILKIKSQDSGQQTKKNNSADLSDQCSFRGAKNLKRKLCWNVGKSKGSFFSQDLLSPMFMNHKINTTKQPHQIWSVVQVHHLTSCQASCWTDCKES